MARTILLILLILIQGCAYSIYDDKRMLDTMSSDQTMAKTIKAALLKNHFTDAFSISVYCYYDHVFLVGEIPEDIQQKAMEIARSCHPASVTPCWFAAAKGTRSDIILAADLRAALIGTKGLSSTRIDTEVNGGRVVLLGVVQDEREKNLAIGTARKVKGVTSVISYLLLPPRPSGKKL